MVCTPFTELHKALLPVLSPLPLLCLHLDDWHTILHGRLTRLPVTHNFLSLVVLLTLLDFPLLTHCTVAMVAQTRPGTLLNLSLNSTPLTCLSGDCCSKSLIGWFCVADLFCWRSDGKNLCGYLFPSPPFVSWKNRRETQHGAVRFVPCGENRHRRDQEQWPDGSRGEVRTLNRIEIL